MINAAKAVTSPSAAQAPINAAKKSSAYRNAKKNQTNAQKAKNATTKIKALTQRLREAHVKAFCTLDRAKVKTDWESTIRELAIRVRIGSQLYALVMLKEMKWYLDSHTMVPELVGFITSPLARGIAYTLSRSASSEGACITVCPDGYSFIEAQGAFAIAGAMVLAPELAAGGPAGVAVDASIAAIGSLMLFVGDAGRQQAADDLAEEWSHSSSSETKPQYKAGDKTPGGREYTKHGANRANERGFDSEKIDSIIDNNYKKRVKEIDKDTGTVTWRYQDKRGNTVITNEWSDKIVTVYSYPEAVNGGTYISKGKAGIVL